MLRATVWPWRSATTQCSIRRLSPLCGSSHRARSPAAKMPGMLVSRYSFTTTPRSILRPALSAESAGLKIDRGVVVNEYLETSIPGIFAAGDLARWLDPHSGDNLRIEHWVVAERQGQTVARNMLGQRQPFTDVPFFWSQHYDVPINYVGHAEKWDDLAVEGDIKARDSLVRYRKGGNVLAVASVYRDLDSLKAELAMEMA